MVHLPRIALGSLQPDLNHLTVLRDLVHALKGLGLQVQAFRSKACTGGCDELDWNAGESLRHLDSWLMSRETCREVFHHGAQDIDVAIVEGSFVTPACPACPGGSLTELCDWLDLPRIGVIDLSRLDPCRFNDAFGNVDGLLLCGASSRRQAEAWRVTLEVFGSAPVLGYTTAEHPHQLHQSIACHGPAVADGTGNELARSLDVKALLGIAGRRMFPNIQPCLFRPRTRANPVNISVALDEAFHYYFPDTLDVLETRGARIRDFSPIHDEMLPVGTDIVYLGSGPAERHADSLAKNYCMKEALRRHVAAGGRIYAEGSGLAYLAQQMILPDGQRLPMSGVLPVNAIYDHAAASTRRPIQLTLVRDIWLGHACSKLRGYLNCDWTIVPSGNSPIEMDESGRMQLVSRNGVIGSRLNVDFAAQPDLLDGFFQPVSNEPDAVTAR